MQQIIGIILIGFGISFFLYTWQRASWKGYKAYHTFRSYSGAIVAILLGLGMLFKYVTF